MREHQQTMTCIPLRVRMTRIFVWSSWSSRIFWSSVDIEYFIMATKHTCWRNAFMNSWQSSEYLSWYFLVLSFHNITPPIFIFNFFCHRLSNRSLTSALIYRKTAMIINVHLLSAMCKFVCCSTSWQIQSFEYAMTGFHLNHDVFEMIDSFIHITSRELIDFDRHLSASDYSRGKF